VKEPFWKESREDLAREIATDWAERDNEADSHCGPRGTETADDHMEAALAFVDRIRARGDF
jgi:hypothetical protein